MTDTATGLAPLFRGNSFLLVLLSAVKKDFGAASEKGKSINGLTRTALFSDLIKTLSPSYEPKNDNDRFAPYISKYLNGDPICSRSYYPFDSEDFQEEVKECFASQYDDALSAMNDFCYKYLDMPSEANGNSSKTIRRLVAGIIDIMLLDKTFDEKINTGYRTVEKKELSQENKFILQPFLLDVWYKILTKYSGKIDHGKIDDMLRKKEAWKESYNALTNEVGDNQPRTLKTEIGRKRAEKIEVSVTFTKPQAALDDDINSLEALEEEKVMDENINDVNNDSIDENAADVDDATNESNRRKANPKYIQFANTIKNIGDIDNKGGNITIHFD